MSEPAYWTAADDAELAFLLNELLRAFYPHRERCAACSTRFDHTCPRWGEAIDALLDWARHRHLLSRAEYLRRRLEEAAA